MTAATELGAIIFPPAPAFYLKPNSIQDIIDQIAARAIDLLGEFLVRWQRLGRKTDA